MVSPKINGPKVNKAQYTSKRVSNGRGCDEPQIWLNVVSMVLINSTADTMSRYPHEFSGGQRQRLAIARALVVRPQVLILDEPTSALDVRLQKHILRLLAKLQQQYGLSMLIISHDLDVIAALSQRMLVLQQGQVVEQGEVAAIFANPQHAYTQTLLKHR